MKPKEVLVFIGSLTGGGAERVVVELSRHLVDRGYSVTVVTMHAGDRDFYTLDARVRRVCLDLAGENKGVGKITANIRRVMALRAVIKDEKPDCIVGMMTGAAIFSILAGLGLPHKVVVSERNFPGRKETVGRWALLRKIFYRLADAHVAQTREAADWLAANTGAGNITVIPNSVTWPLPVNAPVLKPEAVIDENDRLILAVGSLSEQKGFDLLVAAFSGICVECPTWKIVILGEEGEKDKKSRQREKLESLIKQKNLSGRVLMPGRAGNIGDWYERADIFVLSSRFEGFPNALLEAMAAGCPCISFDCDTGPRDIIEDGENGVLVPAENVAAMGREMKKLIQDNEARALLGAKAVQVRQTFAVERVLGMWETLIREPA